MSSGLPLDTLANTIGASLDKSIQHRIAAAKHLAEAKDRVEAGEAGDISFDEWCAKNVRTKDGKQRSLPEILRLVSYGKSDDAEMALLKRREQVRDAVARHAAKKKASGLANPEPGADATPIPASTAKPAAESELAIDADACRPRAPASFVPGELPELTPQGLMRAAAARRRDTAIFRLVQQKGVIYDALLRIAGSRPDLSKEAIISKLAGMPPERQWQIAHGTRPLDAAPAPERAIQAEPAEAAAPEDARQDVVPAEQDAVEPSTVEAPMMTEPEQIEIAEPPAPAKTDTVFAGDAALIDTLAATLIQWLPRGTLARLVARLDMAPLDQSALAAAIRDSLDASEPDHAVPPAPTTTAPKPVKAIRWEAF
jgi:hypothetical protein